MTEVVEPPLQSIRHYLPTFAGVPLHYMAPQLRAVRRPPKGWGVYAIEPVPQGTLLVLWGGVVVADDVFDCLPDDRRRHSLQIDEGLYLVASELAHPADHFNHSCDPNAGLRGQMGLEAMRDIEAGEEVCYDYAMSDGSTYDEFPCFCGTRFCRGRVAGDDWRLLDLQERYCGYFSPYLARRIERARAEARRNTAVA